MSYAVSPGTKAYDYVFIYNVSVYIEDLLEAFHAWERRA